MKTTIALTEQGINSFPACQQIRQQKNKGVFRRRHPLHEDSLRFLVTGTKHALK